MAKITFEGRTIACRSDETVLDALVRNGVELPFSCKKGTCLTCLVRVTEGAVPREAQAGLKETLQVQGYTLACQLRPTGSITIERAHNRDLFSPATVESIEPLAQRVVRLRLRTPTPLYYRAGQFVNLRRSDGLIRSYSLASVPRQDPLLELHVRRQDNGTMSSWLTGVAKPGDQIEFQGPNGSCFYVPGRPEQPLLLVGTGTGAAPLIGLARDALADGHTGPIAFYHGTRHPEGLYLREALEAFALRHLNFHYIPCVSGLLALRATRAGRAHAVALNDHASLAGMRIFACGQPDMVHTLRRQAYLAGASLADIHGDPFDVRDLRATPRATAAETAGESNDAARPDAPPESAAASRSFANPFSR
jgi:NAD(P)H-flavin reductase